MPPPRVYITVSRSGQIRRPCRVTSSPVLTTAVTVADGAAERTPRRKRAPPTPPASTTICTKPILPDRQLSTVWRACRGRGRERDNSWGRWGWCGVSLALGEVDAHATTRGEFRRCHGVRGAAREQLGGRAGTRARGDASSWPRCRG